MTQVQTLLNTTFGQPGPNSYLRFEFFGSAGADYTKAFIGNSDIRDLNNHVWTNSINGTSTVNVFITGIGYRMDKQTIDLPSEFANQTLTKIRMIDTGAFDFQRAVLYGVTVASSSPDLAPTSLAWNPTQGGVDFSYQVTGATCHRTRPRRCTGPAGRRSRMPSAGRFTARRFNDPWVLTGRFTSTLPPWALRRLEPLISFSRPIRTT